MIDPILGMPALVPSVGSPAAIQSAFPAM